MKGSSGRAPIYRKRSRLAAATAERAIVSIAAFSCAAATAAADTGTAVAAAAAAAAALSALCRPPNCPARTPRQPPRRAPAGGGASAAEVAAEVVAGAAVGSQDSTASLYGCGAMATPLGLPEVPFIGRTCCCCSRCVAAGPRLELGGLGVIVCCLRFCCGRRHSGASIEGGMPGLRGVSFSPEDGCRRALRTGAELEMPTVDPGE